MHVTRTLVLLAAALGTLLPAACATTTAPPTAAPTSTAAAASQHNPADVAFAQGMIPHHEQAVNMSQLAAQQGASPQVKELAANIERAQAPEIAQLRGFLAAWGVAEDSSMGGMHHGPGGMPGMMSAEQMHGLGQATGASFDRSFLQMMIMHHEGAVGMARAELADGTNPDARALATAIVDQQAAEVARMQDLLKAV